MITKVIFSMVLLLAKTCEAIGRSPLPIAREGSSAKAGFKYGMHEANQINGTLLDKNMDTKVKKMTTEALPGCLTATYQTTSITQYIYEYLCFPKIASWTEFLTVAEEKIIEISNKIEQQVVREKKTIQPELHDVFKAFNVPLNEIKVIILGQGPTPTVGQPTGLAFSLQRGVDPRKVPSVFNVLVELKWEGFCVGLDNGDLTPWQNQGVLLLNSALTTVKGQKQSHMTLWEPFTTALIEYISFRANPSAWILWGKEAQKFEYLIHSHKHYVKKGGHPSPYSEVEFFGQNYFKCANDFLLSHNRRKVDWHIPSQDLTPNERC